LSREKIIANPPLDLPDLDFTTCGSARCGAAKVVPQGTPMIAVVFDSQGVILIWPARWQHVPATSSLTAVIS